MKTLKKFVGLTLGLMFSLCFCAFTACGGNSDNGDDNVTAYTFLVKNADGSNVDAGYYVQLCKVDENGNQLSCDMPIEITDGKAVYSPIAEPGAYEVHVLSSSYAQVELKEHYVTNSEKFETYTIYLK